MTEPIHPPGSGDEIDSAHLEDESPRGGSPQVHWPDTPSPTGDAPVDRALEELGRIRDVPVQDHADLYGRIHDSLSAALDSEPGLPPASPRNPDNPGLEGDS